MPVRIETPSLILVNESLEATRTMVAAMSEEDRAELSPAWLSLLESSAAASPWVTGFRMVRHGDNEVVGQCAFKGPPTDDGMVEIAYGVSPEMQGQGYATEAAAVLTEFALTHPDVLLVIAHTLRETNASTRVLTKCGFVHVGEVVDPDDGPVWRWERRRVIK